MPNESFFMAIGAIGVSLAGFAGLISALNPTPGSRSAIAAYRLSGIVFLGFTLTLAGFGTIAAYTISGEDLTLTVRVGTLLLLIPQLRGYLQARPGPAWPNERERRLGVVSLAVLTVITLGNLVVASLGYLLLLMLASLIGPIQIFYNTVLDAARPDAPSEPATSGAPVRPASEVVEGIVAGS